MILKKRLFRYMVLMTAQLLFMLVSHFIIILAHHFFGLPDKIVILMSDTLKLFLFVINLWWGYLAAEEFKWYNIVFSLISGALFLAIIQIISPKNQYGDTLALCVAGASQIAYWELLRILKIFTFKKPQTEIK
jgi:hypothetical protein